MTDKTDGVSAMSAELGLLAEAAGLVNLLNNGAGSCVYSEGCHGVTPEHLARLVELVRAAERERLSGIVPRVLEDLNDSLCAENGELRRLLAVRVAGAMLYTDDGELSDGTQMPCIDFKRDAATLIADKLRQRGRANYERSLEADKLLFKS